MTDGINLLGDKPDSHYLLRLDNADIEAEQLANVLANGGLKADRVSVTKLRGGKE